MSIALHCRWLLRPVNICEKTGVRWYQKAARGLQPEKARNLAQRIAQMNYKDPTLHYRVNIGYPLTTLKRKEVMYVRQGDRMAMKKNHELELAARHRTIKLDMEKVHEDWALIGSPTHIYETAKYYNIFDDLFEASYFYPVTPLNIAFPYPKDDTIVTPVYRGNLITPFEATAEPEVSYPASTDDLFTLQMTTPDGHFSLKKGEYLHWMVGNIPGNEVNRGEVLCDYMRPFPVRGLGYGRYIFVLYKQEHKIDFSAHRRDTPCTNLTARTFSTYDFYRDLQDHLTPAGLSFFESTWDHSLTDFFHNVLEMKEPVVEYDFPAIKLAPQRWFPYKKPFNLYMDTYKHPKQLQKELLTEKLKERHPFKPAPVPPKFPLGFTINKHLASWRKTDIKQRRMKEGKYKFM